MDSSWYLGWVRQSVLIFIQHCSVYMKLLTSCVLSAKKNVTQCDTDQTLTFVEILTLNTVIMWRHMLSAHLENNIIASTSSLLNYSAYWQDHVQCNSSELDCVQNQSKHIMRCLWKGSSLHDGISLNTKCYVPVWKYCIFTTLFTPLYYVVHKKGYGIVYCTSWWST